jgi:hypothetical protein
VFSILCGTLQNDGKRYFSIYEPKGRGFESLQPYHKKDHTDWCGLFLLAQFIKIFREAWILDLLTWLTRTLLGRLTFTTLVSMVPVVELRGGIPFGVALGLTHWQAFLAAVVGNLLPLPFIVVYIRRIFQWMRGRLPAMALGVLTAGFLVTGITYGFTSIFV